MELESVARFPRMTKVARQPIHSDSIESGFPGCFEAWEARIQVLFASDEMPERKNNGNRVSGKIVSPLVWKEQLESHPNATQRVQRQVMYILRVALDFHVR